MSEATLQTELQTVLQAMSQLDNDDVVIHDWSILDRGNSDAPYAIITAADGWSVRFRAAGTDAAWDMGLILIHKFRDWKESLDDFVTFRDAVVSQFESNDLTSAVIEAIRSEAPIDYLYDQYVQDPAQASPIFIMQPLLITVRED